MDSGDSLSIGLEENFISALSLLFQAGSIAELDQPILIKKMAQS